MQIQLILNAYLLNQQIQFHFEPFEYIIGVVHLVISFGIFKIVWIDFVLCFTGFHQLYSALIPWLCCASKMVIINQYSQLGYHQVLQIRYGWNGFNFNITHTIFNKSIHILGESKRILLHWTPLVYLTILFREKHVFFYSKDTILFR